MRKANIIITALVILSGFIGVFGQGSAPLSRTPGSPAGSYSLSDSDTVNLFNGNLNFDLPLLSVGGRGEVKHGISLTLETEWSVTTTENVNGYITQEFSPITKKGLSLVSSVTAESNIVTDFQSPCSNDPYALIYWTHHQFNLKFIAPDGTEQVLIDRIYHGREHTECGSIGFNYGRIFDSTDGSFMMFVADADMSNQTAALTGYLIYKNGTKSRVVNTQILWTEDRNGNKIEYTYDTTPYHRLTKIKDSVGREVNVEYNINDIAPYGLCDRVIYKGSVGQNRIIRVSKDSLHNLLRTTHPSDSTTIKTIAELFNDLPDDYILFANANQPYDDESVKTVWLPDGRKYDFKYDVYGRLARYTLPTGGATEYDYEQNGVGGNYGLSVPTLTKEKRIYDLNNTLLNKTVFTRNLSYIASPPFPAGTASTIVDMETFDPSGNRQEKSRHFFYSTAGDNGGFTVPFTTGKEFKTEIFDTDGITLLRRIEKTWKERIPAWCYVILTGNIVPCGSNPALTVQTNNPFVVETKETLADGNLVKLTSSVNPTTGGWAFDQYNNPTDTWEYDYGVGAPGAFKRRSHTDYVTDANYINANLKGLPSQSWVSSDIDGTTKASLTQYEYDNYTADSRHAALVPRTSVVGHDTANFGTNYTTRGNVTKVTSYADAQNQTGAVAVSTQYDILGNVVKTTDAKGCSTTIDYADRFGSPDNEARSNIAPTQLGGLSTFAFPTSSTNCLNWVVGYSQFDYFTGQAVNTEDLNGNVSKTIYNDVLDRPTQSVSAIGTPFERQSNITYHDELTERRVEVKSDLFALNDNLSKSESFYDGLGRTFESRKYESDGGYITSITEFDALGRPKRATNPYRPLRNEPQLWTENFYDSLSRITKVKTPDQAEVLTNYSGNVVTVTDQALKKRRSVTNALGQLIRIDEPNDAGLLDVNGTPAQSTNYSYNTLGSLVKVSQGSQNRFFKYDSLGRLIRLRQPEQATNSALLLGDIITANNDWSIGSTYDNNGNVLTTTDAKNVVTTYTYDALNRPLTRSYNDGTPAVTNTYDAAGVDYSKGQLTEVSNSISTSKFTQFDNLGKPKVSQQITEGNTYTSSYQYNLVGDLVQETYPSGRVVKNDYNANNEISKIYGQKNATATMQTYANAIGYTASGAIEKIKLGNGRWESARFNNRLQVTELAVGSSVGDGSLWKLNYEFGELQTDNSVDASKNSGNIAKQTINFNGLANPIYQGYKYDSLNRVTEAKETVNSQTTWQQNFGYDRYGNRTSFNQVVNGNQLQMNNLTLPNVDASTNRISSSGYVYDANGNLINDPQGRQFTFNGDNKQTQVKDANNQVIGQYFYDGSGKRIKKVTNTETTIFVYSGSKLIAEYSTQQATNPTTSYTATDMLGSPRVITDANGQVISRRDFMAFGEEIAVGFGGRNTTSKYGQSDSVRQRFTGYQKDDETGLDFAEARYYNDAHGRFTAVDPLLASGKSTNPQTFNRYVYSMNRPLILTDPTGMQSGTKPKDDDNKPIKVDINVNNNAPRILDVKVKYLDKDQYGTAVPIGGKFQITYKYLINKPNEGDKPGDFASIESVPRKKTEIKEGKEISTTTEKQKDGGTFATAENVEKVGKSEVKVIGTKDEAVIVTKTETFLVKPRSNMAATATGTINFQIVVKDPQLQEGNGDTKTPKTAVFSTLNDKDSDKQISVRNEPVRP